MKRLFRFFRKHDFEYAGKCRVARCMKGVTFTCKKCGESVYRASSKGVKEKDVDVKYLNTFGCKGEQG